MWVATVGVPINMLRNFGIRNIELPFPIRSDQYNIGPGDVIFTNIDIITKGIKINGNSKHANEKSKILFIKITVEIKMKQYPQLSRFEIW